MTKKITINGQEYDSFNDLPPDIQAKIRENLGKIQNIPFAKSILKTFNVDINNLQNMQLNSSGSPFSNPTGSSNPFGNQPGGNLFGGNNPFQQQPSNPLFSGKKTRGGELDWSYSSRALGDSFGS